MFEINDHNDDDNDGNRCERRSLVLTQTATDQGQCASDWLKWIVFVDLWGDGTNDYEYSSFLPATDASFNDTNGNGIPDRYVAPTGQAGEVRVTLPEDIVGSMSNHKITRKVLDGCGNVTNCTQNFMVVDKKKPTPYCLNISSALMSNGQVELWAVDFNLGSFDNCTSKSNLLYTFNEANPVLTKINQIHYFKGAGLNATEAEYNAGNAQKWLPATKSSGQIFNCDDAPSVDVKMTVWDEKLSYDFCVVTLNLADNQGACGNAQTTTVTGNNSGWAWHLFAAPAIWIARLRGTPVIVNYRGGEAQPFFAAAPGWVHRTLASASMLVVPSAFLDGVFRDFGFKPVIVPNIINLERFGLPKSGEADAPPHVVVTRNLEPIYDIPTVLSAFSRILPHLPGARLTIAGSGPELARLEALAVELKIADAVRFAGRIDNEQIPALYASADLMIKPSTVDNMPISILEAFASRVPVVSTDVGGVPFIAEHGRTALLVPARDPRQMAEAMLDLLVHKDKACRMSEAAREEVKQYAWQVIGAKWRVAYQRAISQQG